MNTHEKHRIIRGDVFVDGRWVPIHKKLEIDRQRRKKIEEGYVFYRGEWMTIKEKLLRVLPPKASEEKRPSSIVINNYDNRSYSTIDQRTVHHHEHRHVHVDGELLGEYVNGHLPQEASPAVHSIDSDKRKRKALSGSKKKKMIDNEGKSRKLLMPPGED